MDIVNKLRWQADEAAEKGYLDFSNTMREAADKLESKNAELWAINDELVKAGFEMSKHKTFAECVAVLRERVSAKPDEACACRVVRTEITRVVNPDCFTHCMIGGEHMWVTKYSDDGQYQKTYCSKCMKERVSSL